MTPGHAVKDCSWELGSLDPPSEGMSDPKCLPRMPCLSLHLLSIDAGRGCKAWVFTAEIATDAQRSPIILSLRVKRLCGRTGSVSRHRHTAGVNPRMAFHPDLILRCPDRQLLHGDSPAVPGRPLPWPCDRAQGCRPDRSGSRNSSRPAPPGPRWFPGPRSFARFRRCP